MSAPPYMRLYWGDYFRDTRRLNRLEHSAYLLLLGEMWVQGGKLPADDDTLARATLCTAEEWDEIKGVVLSFFKVSRGKLTQKRLSAELAKYDDTLRKRKMAGQKGGKASHGKGEGNTEANAKHLPTKPEPEPEPKKELELVAEATPKPKPARVYPEAFEAAWKQYPHHKGRSSKPNAAAQWARLPENERAGLVAAIARFAPNVAETCGGKGAPDMAVWLKDGKHLNWQAEAGLDLAPAPSTFDAPKVRASIVHATDEDFARSFLDHYCRWDQGTRTIEASRPAVAATLTRKLAGWAERNSVTIAVASANDGAALKQTGEAA